MPDDSSVFPTIVLQLPIYQGYAFINIIQMGLNDIELVTLDTNEFISMDAVEDILIQRLDAAVRQL